MTSKPLYSAILVANRGEIAVRIIRTLKRLSIKSVAIYSTEDTQSQHVRDADSSFLLPGHTLADTYLSIENIITVAKEAGAEAIIPGYGFLSESAEFAGVCGNNGLIWIGPTPKQMQSLGLKHQARELAEQTGVPVLQGSAVLESVDGAIAAAEMVGYPVILKSSAGGGGIGLQKCSNVHELREKFDTVQHLGTTYFNDDRVFVEKYVEDARHIEVQIIGNGEGLVKHVWDRDCSMQRRKQKIIEEAPAIFVPEEVRTQMRESAMKLAASVCYRGVGTVEFLYDLNEKKFFFLEVNTRLQVEHTVTEAVSGLDLVEAMLRVAANDSTHLFSDSGDDISCHGVAIEARIYGESPLQGFRPSSGQLQQVIFPDGVRVDTWVRPGTVVSSSYDPLLAKIIVIGSDRTEAVEHLSTALDAIQLSGIETNVGYLRRIVGTEDFQRGTYTTTTLDNFKFISPAFEVLEPGPSTTIQDFPGRVGLWHIGVPPSGPMDDYAFRVANRILGNEPGTAALECTHAGPKLLFHHDAHIAVVGELATLQINDIVVPRPSAHLIKAGQTLRLGALEAGCRAYIAIHGGIDVPEVFGSRSTFALGKTGGHCGRVLSTGDLIPFKKATNVFSLPVGEPLSSIVPIYTSSWTLKVMPGPHAFPDFFSKSSFTEFFEQPWKVHYNSNRVGVRLTGPKPKWARENGGAAGLHPSNIHDSPYSIGSISFTGDEAVILTCDGPSLGGFVVFATVISAEMWKVGQMKPGDEILLSPVTISEAMLLETSVQNSINSLSPMCNLEPEGKIGDPILGNVGSEDIKIICRQAGDRAVLLEFGTADFDIQSSTLIYRLMNAHRDNSIPGLVELTPGVRSLHVLYDWSIKQDQIVLSLREAVSKILSGPRTSVIPSRIFNLPFAFEHPSCLAAVERYSQTIRSEAPWLPNNVEFLQRINGLASKNDVESVVLSTTYLILGLGDVFFGAPCAIPLDPRHRLFGMKYNPSRSFTPEGAIGLGGQYLCIYGIDSPGGYQLVGRTVPIWNTWAKKGYPWMFNVFDQIQFYPISTQELDAARDSRDTEKLVDIVEGIFDLQAYENWLQENQSDITTVTQNRWQTMNESDAVAQALLPPSPRSIKSRESTTSNSEVATNQIEIRAGVAGKCWKSAVSVGDKVEKGQTLFWIEAMKMEIGVVAPSEGVCAAIFASPGDILAADSLMAALEPMGQ
ncbi:hypothetical protein EG329_011470 [Mollisiaceae sp. DMI_Dod_QoI]|nr:hypothetical protein EG329_011470 [Helotiales sp. DMI_Dod_QoI]